MRITKVKLKDFGRFADLTLDHLQHVVGLEGENSKGKSTILTAIEFAYTGILPDNAETYVRNYGREGGAQNASVTVEFSKDGVEGVIFRQVGKTAKRVLTWAGQEYTKAKEVDQMMQEILGADKAALSNAIFIAQGSLAELMFGTPGQRQELFTRLLNIGYIEQRTGALDGKLKVLSDGLQDFSALKDELKASLKTSSENLEVIQEERKTLRNYSEEIALWTQLTTHANNISDAAGKLQQSQQETSRTSQALEAYLQNLPVELTDALQWNMRSIDPEICKTNVEKHKTAYGKLRDSWQKNELAVSEQRRQAVLQDILKKAQDNLDRTTAELETCKSSSPVPVETIQAELEKIQQQAMDYVMFTQKSQNINKLEKLVQEAGTEVLRLKAAAPLPWNPGEKENLQTILEEILEDGKLKATRLKILQGVKANLQGAVEECPVCGSKLLNASGLSDEGLDQLYAEVNLGRTTYKSLSESMITRDALLQKSNRDISTAEAMLASHTESLRKAKEDLPKTQTPPDVSLQQTLKEIQQKVHTLTAQLTEYTQAVLKASEAVKGLTPVVVLSEAETETLRGELQKTEEFVRKMVETEKIISSLELGMETSRRNLSISQARMQEAAERLTAHADRLSKEEAITELLAGRPVPTRINAEEAEVYQQVKLEMDTRQQRRNELDGRIREAEKQLKETQQKLSDLTVRISKDAKQRELIDKLKTLKTAMAKDGIPAAYLRYRFEQLLDLVQEQLAVLQANFIVDLDPDQPMTFRFCRLDEPEEYWMDQNKLSGGQRVRLTVAFLLAVQKLVIPEVGFLVLDEPSQHMDAAGVESLKELLSQLGETLGNTDAQVWVCDHRPELAAAYGSLFRLT